MSKNDFKSRLIIERDELNKKIELLNKFLITDKFLEIDEEHQDLLSQQHLTMLEYRNILDKRIELVK